jgi:hypothetical protein
MLAALRFSKGKRSVPISSGSLCISLSASFGSTTRESAAGQGNNFFKFGRYL